MATQECMFVNHKFINGCSALDDCVKCNPMECKWKKTKEEYFESLYKAMKNLENRTGRKDYIDKCIFGETLKQQFKTWLRKKAKEAE